MVERHDCTFPLVELDVTFVYENVLMVMKKKKFFHVLLTIFIRLASCSFLPPLFGGRLFIFKVVKLFYNQSVYVCVAIRAYMEKPVPLLSL